MFEALLEHPIMLRLGWTLIHSVWQGLLLAGLLSLALLLLGPDRNRLRYALASLTLLLWLATPAVTFLMLSPQVLTGSQTVPTVVVATAPSNTRATEPKETLRDGAVEREAVPRLTTSLATVSQLNRLIPYAALTWLTTAVLLSLRLLGGLMSVHNLRQSGAPLPRLEAQLRALAARLGIIRHVRLLVSSRVDVPTALGWLRPVVLLPGSTLTGLSALQLELILAHELAHIRRNDYLVNVLQGVAEALLFYHPLTWWLSHTLRTEREHACDELALEATGAAPLELAETLARLEAARPTLAPTLAATGSLARRMHRLLRVPQPAPARTPANLPALLPALAIVPLGLWLALAAQPPALATNLLERHPDGQLTGPYFEPPEGDWGPTLSLSELSALATFPIDAPTYLPEGFRFDNATWNEQLQSAALTYGAVDEDSAFRQTHFITIMQAPVRTYQPVPVGAEATIEPVAVGPAAGEYVTGYWQGDWNAPPADRDLHWDRTAGQLIAWREGGMVYLIATDQIPNTGTEFVSRDVLLQMASSLVAIYPTPGTPDATPHLPSGKTRQWATIRGEVTFTADYSDLLSIGEGGSMTIEERRPAGARRVIVTTTVDGRFDFQYSESGSPAAFDDEARAWYQQALADFVLTPLGALEIDQRHSRYQIFNEQRDGYQSLIGLPDDRGYEIDLREPRDGGVSPQILADLELLTHAAAHGLISRGLLEVALIDYLQLDFNPDATASFRYAISHLDSEAARQRLHELLRQQTEGSNA